MAGSSSALMSCAAATWIADGNVSLDDWEAFTWSLGCTLLPSRSVARVASTSLVFMLVDVPDPVWKTSIGNSSSHSPATTSPATAMIAFATSSAITPSSAFIAAAERLIAVSAWTRAGSTRSPLTGKFSTARWVCARHLALLGTRTSPIESCSVRYSLSVTICRLAEVPARRRDPLERDRRVRLQLGQLMLALHPPDGAAA